ncbi:MAG: hypothetical protein QOH25_4010 [Acidobacteriota bacterium]|jgi:hypothetical protein|nr:hypothetical protein [Acidobacteriota bacterium]
MPPLRGLFIYLLLVTMTHVMGYCYIAPPGLAVRTPFTFTLPYGVGFFSVTGWPSAS